MSTKLFALWAFAFLAAACGGGGGSGGENGGTARGAGVGASAGGGGPPRGQSEPQEFYAAPVKVSETLHFTAIAAGYHHACAIEAAGDTYCWGYDEYDQLGSSTAMETCVDGMYACSSVPVRVDGALRFAALTASIRHTCGLDASGSAYCWGFGLGGQLGDGLRANSRAPVAVAGGLKFTALSGSVASGDTCGITTTGEAWCWGINIRGELGNGTSSVTPAPSPVATSLRFSSISIGDQHACAVDTAGNALCWGDNWFGQLGVGSAGGGGGFRGSDVPVAVLGGQKYEQIAAAGMHTCALQESGAAFCWGLPPQLGAATGNVYEALPVPVELAGSKWVSLGRGYGQTCALAEDGGLYCWGQLTDFESGATAKRPVRIVSAQPFVAFSAGGTHACAIGADRFAYCWGINSWGQVGRPPSDP